MERLNEHCAGLDVHKKSVTVCVRVTGKDGEREAITKTFGTTTAELELLNKWLVSSGVTVAGMEATGVYWKPVFYALESQMTCWLLNAQHIRNVPGRKTDVADAAWIAQLVEYGLVRPSFVPPPAVRALRQMTRYRKSLVEERTREGQRLDKVLQDASIKLTSVVSTIFGATALAIVAALVEGTREPEALAELAKGRLRSKIPELRKALEGHFGDEHAFLARIILRRIADLQSQVDEVSAEIALRLETHKDAIANLDTIPGVNQRTAEVILAEAGFEIARFESPQRLASWAGLCPGNNESAGKRRPTRTGHGSRALRTALVEAASAAARTRNTYLSAQYKRLAARRGHGRAIVAVAHGILVTAYWVLLRNEPYRDLGPHYFTDREKDHRVARLIRQLEQLGQIVTVSHAA